MRRATLHALGWALIAAAGIALVLWVNEYYVFVLANVALLVIVGVGLNVLIGLTGQVSFGHVGFYAIGAYAVGVLMMKAGWPFWPAWLAGAALAGATGALLALPALRVRGPYLAMITIAFGFIVEHGAVELRDLTGGQNGLMGIAGPALGGFARGERAIAVLAVVTAVISTAAFMWLSRGTWGAAMRAVRDSETAAESVGLNPLTLKTTAFAISAVLAGLAGGLYAPLSSVITPGSFGFVQSILFVLVVMIGGSGAVAGPAIGAVVVGVLPEMLSRLEEYRLLFFGGLLLVVLWAAPQGVAGLFRSLYTRLAGRRHAAVGENAAADARALAPLTSRVRSPLKAHDLTMTFGGVRAVQGLELAAAPGEVTSLIGPNGAGKSTVLNVLSGFYRATAGVVALGETMIDGRSAHAISRAGVARTYQTSQLFGSLTVEENVSIAATRGRLGTLLGAARLRSPAVRARSRELLAYCGYSGRLDAPAADLSHVDRRLVEIARALATDPDVLLLDEPAAGLSREDKARLAGLLKGIAAAGAAVVLVEHDMRLVMAISDRVVVLDAGQLLAVGMPAAIQKDEAVRQAYLGEGMAPAVSRPPRSDGTPEEALGVGRLSAGYGAEPVLRDVTLTLRKGESLALLGANGAGKSTLMRSLAGLHRPVDGGIHVHGAEIAHLDAERIVQLGLVLVPEGRQVFPDLSVADNIRLGAFLQRADIDARVEAVLLRFPPLRARLHQRAGLLSGGEQQMLAIARGLMAKPRILLLDEPSLGLAPKVIEELFAALDRLRQEAMTLLLVDQMAALALSLADRACIIDSGRVVAEGTAAEIAADTALVEAYLGVD